MMGGYGLDSFAQDRDQWLTFVSTVVILRFHGGHVIS
jgi:hypothetical protein